MGSGFADARHLDSALANKYEPCQMEVMAAKKKKSMKKTAGKKVVCEGGVCRLE